MSVGSKTLAISGVLLAATQLVAACAFTRVHADGTVEYWGLARVTVPALQAQPAAMQFAVEGIGLLLVSSPAGGGVVLGYGSHSFTLLADDALACFPPRASSAATARAVALDLGTTPGGER